VPKEPGRSLGGHLNHRGFLVFTATRVGQDMVLSQIIVWWMRPDGKAHRALVDRVAAIFVPVVMAWRLTFWSGTPGARTAFSRAIISMVAV